MASPYGGSREMAQALDGFCYHGDDLTRLGQGSGMTQKGGAEIWSEEDAAALIFFFVVFGQATFWVWASFWLDCCCFSAGSM